MSRWSAFVCLVSCPAQLAVTDKKAAHICVLIYGHKTRIYKVTRSETVIKHIIHAERYFGECVEKDVPSDVNTSKSVAKAIQQFYPQHVPLTVEDLSYNDQANQLFSQLLKERHHIEIHQTLFDETKHQIQMLMKDAEKATFAHGSITWKKSKDCTVLDGKAVLKLHPEMLQQFPQQKAGTRRFQIYTDD